ncbi:MAG: NAD(P)-dependent glycerol-3-phosphate dehydrogenase [Myxococcales bacterium]|nr:NAD(P)-dependent glycerol-3-phosphate dehydrogenase [Myxococcales bacterium]
MKVGVIGAGSWGTALSKLCADAGHAVSLWAYEKEVAEQIRAGCNETYLPGVELPPLDASNNLAEVVSGRELLISVMPSHVVREVWSGVRDADLGDPIVVSATKGIENVTLATMVEVLRESLPVRLHDRLAALSGPSFAVEVGNRLPTAVVVASPSADTARTVQKALSTDRFRIYTSDDVVGVEVGGAAKNVIAIAAGVAEGLRFGHNTRAALITRGLAEITRLAVAKAGNPMTLAGLAGMGDLVLTCTGGPSRNRSVGLRLGQGESLEAIQASMKAVAEGVRSAKSCLALGRRLGVEMPITATVHGILYEGLDAREATAALMKRQLKHELE